jgi:hypothetical protein
LLLALRQPFSYGHRLLEDDHGYTVTHGVDEDAARLTPTERQGQLVGMERQLEAAEVSSKIGQRRRAWAVTAPW